MKKFIKDYFTFSTKESYAAITLLIITAIFIALPYFFSSKKNKEPLNASLTRVAGIQLAANDRSKLSGNEENGYERHSNPYNYKNTTKAVNKITPFEFDPNTIDEYGLHKLGLSDKLIKTILNYRSKGGYFKTAEDIRKIWGLKQEDAAILIPYISIVAKPYGNKFSNQAIAKSYEKLKPAIVDINTATVDDLKALPALGNTAYRIIKFREKLGGFIGVNQIKETYGLSDSVYQLILPYLSFSTVTIQKININTASDIELAKHPYISNDIAKAIVIYRKQKGNYNRVEDVKKIVFINQAAFVKIEPYLTVE